jgi:hypothetical protein
MLAESIERSIIGLKSRGRNSVGECHVRNVKVEGSNPFASTRFVKDLVRFGPVLSAS